MLHRIDSYELSEWWALFEMEPWGDVRADLRSGLQTAHLVNLQRDRKRHPQPLSVKDFLLTFRLEEEDHPVILSPKTQQMVSTMQVRQARIRMKRAARGQ